MIKYVFYYTNSVLYMLYCFLSFYICANKVIILNISIINSDYFITLKCSLSVYLSFLCI